MSHDPHADAQAGVDNFDADYFDTFGHYPIEWYAEHGQRTPSRDELLELRHQAREGRRQGREQRREQQARSVRTSSRSDDPRRVAIQNLIERGATEGEREAARAALARVEAQDEEDFFDALRAGEV